MKLINSLIKLLAFTACWNFQGLSAQETAAEIVITATRAEQDIFNTPGAVSVINHNQIQESNLSSTPDLFRHTEGVYIQKTNLGGGSPFIRGLTGKQVLILVDGIRLNNSYYRLGPHQYLNTLDPGSIERVEIVRGPGSVLYGSDALGGVINIITKKRRDFLQPFDADVYISTSVDSAVAGKLDDGKTGGYSVHGQSEGNQNGVGWVVGGTAKSYDDLQAGGNLDEQVPSAYQEYAANLNLNRQISVGRELVLGMQFLQQNEVPKTSEVILDGKVKFNYAPQRRTLAYLEYSDRHLGIFDNSKFTFSHNRQKEGEEIISTLPIETRELTDVITVGGSAQFGNLVLNNTQQLTYGLEYYHDRFATSKVSTNLNTAVATSIKPGVPDGATYESLGVYIQDEIRVSSSANLIAALRYSKFTAAGELLHPSEGMTVLELDTDKVTASLQGLLRVSDNINLVGGISQGFRAPNMEDFFGRVDFATEIPNTTLKPEVSLNYEIGVKHATQNTFTDLFYYYTDFKNLINRIDAVDAHGLPVKQRKNVDQAVILGIEGGARHVFNRNWQLGATLAWTQGRDNKDKPLRRMPPVYGSLQLRYTHNTTLWLQLESMLAAKQDELSSGDLTDKRIPFGGTPGYAVFSFKAGYNRSEHEAVLITLENIFDQQYKTHGSGVYGAGLSVVLTYNLDFN